jgi:hypothetical protein
VRVLVALDDERVRNIARQEDEGARAALELLVAGPEPHPPLEHPERFVLAVVDMERGRGAGRDERLDESERTAGRLRRRLDRHPVRLEPRRLAFTRRREQRGHLERFYQNPFR